ncbi:hypothetical protein TSUD_128640 [Trifolium subterraneum]|uniref:Cytochrome P450 n=1 Tax=Trifolium subterraneum TaxID=3900 RepID=A0A2Z6MXF9_TRISU|nr:hypothetical protein TSUD_128640 [Trifolium subterraneum]
MQLSSGFYIGDLFPWVKWLKNITGMRSKLEKVHRNIDRILEMIIDDHKETKSRTKDYLVEGEEDLIDVLLKFEDGSSCNQELSLTKRNIKAILFDIFTGGSDTAATTINWTMAEMMKNQRVLQKAQTEQAICFTFMNAKFKFTTNAKTISSIASNDLWKLASTLHFTLPCHSFCHFTTAGLFRVACKRGAGGCNLGVSLTTFSRKCISPQPDVLPPAWCVSALLTGDVSRFRLVVIAIAEYFFSLILLILALDSDLAEGAIRQI